MTQTYLDLRKLENQIIEQLVSIAKNEGEQAAIEQKVSVKQFFGIEINFFASEVAKVALQIAKCQMDVETAVILNKSIESLPLESTCGIVCANALTANWEEVLPAKECNYIIGNPPFVGYSNHSSEQKEDRAKLFSKVKTVDYVACWYKKACMYMKDNKNIHAAFVSTNSICQVQQVNPIWQPLFAWGININFAHKPFIWNSQSADQAHVHVVIIGFSYGGANKKVLFDGNTSREVENINGYLAPAPNVFVEKHAKPLCNVAEMSQGFKPADGGNLLLSTEEYDELIAKEPHVKTLIRSFSMGEEFIKGRRRYCLWLPNVTAADLKTCPTVRKRIDACRCWRGEQTKTGDAYKLKDTPHLLRKCNKFKDETYIGVPKVSSHRRHYVPLGFVDNGMIPGDKLYFISSGSLYVFGVMMSQFQNAWMRILSGRLKSDYSYSNTIVYNNFIWPGVTKDKLGVPVEQCVSVKVRENIEECAQAVLDARALYTAQAKDAGEKVSLADMYDPDNDFLFPKLTAAHKNLDAAVEVAYGVDFKGDEEKIVAHLFGLYAAVASSSS